MGIRMTLENFYAWKRILIENFLKNFKLHYFHHFQKKSYGIFFFSVCFQKLLLTLELTSKAIKSNALRQLMPSFFYSFFAISYL
jgi:hypothetical protein